MNPRPRTGHMDSQRSLMWERWKQGWTLHQIAHLFNRSHASVRVRTARWASRTVRVPRRPPAFAIETMLHIQCLPQRLGLSPPGDGRALHDVPPS